MLKLAALGLGLFLPLIQDPGPPPYKGKFHGDLKDDKGEFLYRVRMFAPETLSPKKKLGLILVFHGSDGHERNMYVDVVMDGLKRLGLTEQYVAIAMKSRVSSWGKEDDEPVKKLIAWAKKHYPLEPRRVFLFGCSAGGYYIGRFGWQNQDLVAGVVGYCAGYDFSKGSVPENPAEKKTEWYFVHGSADGGAAGSIDGARQLREKRYRYVYRQMDDYGHVEIFAGNDPKPDLKVEAVFDDWITWAHALRHKEMGLLPEDEKKLKALEGKSLSKADLAELVRIGGPSAGKIVAAALGAKDSSARAAAAEACEKTLFGKEVVDKLVTCAADESETVRHAALKALAPAADFRYEQAQKTLCEKAASKAPVGERLLAIKSLARAVRCALFGNFEDREMFRTLVALLEDPDGKVRAAAFAALEKGVPDGFGYAPDAGEADRKEAVRRWVDWLAQKGG